ncbi:MAG: hypothetical protein LAN59_03500 [Acidobacteriia bacterium]|nr:hypothetical protein [Terriglobia bacterium]
MKTYLPMIALFLAAALVCGCNKNSQPAPASSSAMPPMGTPAEATPPAGAPSPASASDSDAIRKAIEAHLGDNKGINMSVMDMALNNVQVHGDQAQADAVFRLKQGGATMQMTYFLERHAGGWLVLRNQAAGGQFQHPPTDKTHSGAAPNSASPSLPDVGGYLKDHPAPSKQ